MGVYGTILNSYNFKKEYLMGSKIGSKETWKANNETKMSIISNNETISEDRKWNLLDKYYL